MTSRFVAYLLLIVAAFVYGLVVYRKLPISARGIVVLLGVVFFSECLSRLVIDKFGTNFPSYHLLIPLQMILYWFIYSRFFLFSHGVVLVLNISALVLITGTLVTSIFIQPILEFPSYGTSFICLLVSGCAILGFSAMLNHPVDVPLVKQPGFWFNLGNLLFYTITFFTFGFFNPIIKLLAVLPQWQYSIIWGMNLVLYSSYFITLLLSRKSISEDGNRKF